MAAALLAGNDRQVFEANGSGPCQARGKTIFGHSDSLSAEVAPACLMSSSESIRSKLEEGNFNSKTLPTSGSALISVEISSVPSCSSVRYLALDCPIPEPWTVASSEGFLRY